MPRRRNSGALPTLTPELAETMDLAELKQRRDDLIEAQAGPANAGDLEALTALVEQADIADKAIAEKERHVVESRPAEQKARQLIADKQRQQQIAALPADLKAAHDAVLKHDTTAVAIFNALREWVTTSQVLRDDLRAKALEAGHLLGIEAGHIRTNLVSSPAGFLTAALFNLFASTGIDRTGPFSRIGATLIVGGPSGDANPDAARAQDAERFERNLAELFREAERVAARAGRHGPSVAQAQIERTKEREAKQRAKANEQMAIRAEENKAHKGRQEARAANVRQIQRDAQGRILPTGQSA